MENGIGSKGIPIAGHKHWVEALADKVIGSASPPYIVSAGMTTSGSFHMGTLCEFLYPASIAKYLEKKGKVEFHFSADILDAFDSVPSNMKQYEKELAPHLGKPLCDVPDPTGTSRSFGEHFLEQSLEIVARFGIHPKVHRANEEYGRGDYDKYALLFLDKLEKTRQVIARTSQNQNMSKNWSPIMQICPKCGKIATAEIIKYGEGKGEYVFRCSRATKYTKGCGHEGEGRISDHKYKLQWRLHWPSWMDKVGTHIEGAGIDHHTKGGSWDSLVGVYSEIFNKKPPLSYRWGLVLFGGKKYSKSKGIGMGVLELLQVLPPEVLAYALVRPDIVENRDLNPSGERLLRLMDDYQHAGRMWEKLELGEGEELSRADRKKALAFNIVSKEKAWEVEFSDLLINHILYKDWKMVLEKLGCEKDIKRLSKYVENWEKRGFVPQEYLFEFKPSKPEGNAALEFFQKLDEGMKPVEIHNLVFDVAKKNGMKPAGLFKELYLSIIGRERGPKMGRLVWAIGIGKVKKMVLGTEE